MPIKKFYVKGNGEVIEVGLRPSLMALGSEYSLKVLARNLYEERKVEVIVSGADMDLQRFWRHVKDHDIRPVKDKRGYTVSRPELYAGPEPDWAYCANAFMVEQISKGVRGIDTINEKLGGLDVINEKLGGLDVINEKLGGMDKKLGVMDEKLGGLEAINEKLGGMDEKLGASLKGIDEKLGTGIKGMDEKLGKINTTLGQVGENFAEVSERFGVFGKHVKEISDKLDDLPGRIARALKEGK